MNRSINLVSQWNTLKLSFSKYLSRIIQTLIQNKFNKKKINKVLKYFIDFMIIINYYLKALRHKIKFEFFLNKIDVWLIKKC